jgi:hypothetical protein
VLLRDEQERDRLARQFRIAAVEMEGAGVAASAWQHSLEWFMIRGVVDYCEHSTKNTRWHAYSSLAAAAYTCAVLAQCTPPPGTVPTGWPRVLSMLTESEQEAAYLLFDEVPDERSVLPSWYHAMGELALMSSMRPATLRQAFDHLLKLNCEPDGIPRAVVFVDRIAEDVQPDLRQRLLAWSTRIADRLGLTAALDSRRARVDKPVIDHPALPCLVVEMSKDGLDSEQLTIRHWLQRRAGEWAPERGDDTPNVPVEIAQYVVEKLVAKAETEWADSRENNTVTLEFVLPVALINMPVQWWTSNSSAPEPPALCLDYPVVVRGLERMRAANQYRLWRKRWDLMSREPKRWTIHWGRVQYGKGGLGRWDAKLRTSEPMFTVVVLSGPPTSRPGSAELEMALSAGIPVVLWDRRVEQPVDLRQVVNRLLEGEIDDLPERVRRLRAEAAEAESAEREQHPGEYLALLWDDASRLVDVRG